MTEATPYRDEPARLEALRALNLLDTPIEERFERVTRMVCHFMDVPIALFNLIDADRQHYKSAQGVAMTDAPLKGALCMHTLNESDMLLIPDTMADARFADNPFVTGQYLNIGFYAGCPVRAPNGMPIGTLCAIDIKPREMNDQQLKALRDLASMVETELQVSSLSKTQLTLIEELNAANHLALVDSLTRLWNKNGITRLLDKEWSEAIRQQKPVTVVMTDIDHFKEVNDTYGHALGDQLMKVISKKLVESLRAEDAIGRVEGNRFLMILTDCKPEKMHETIDRIRNKIASQPLVLGQSECAVTISMGAASIVPAQGDDHAGLTVQANDALARAKAGGRNRVECC